MYENERFHIPQWSPVECNMDDTDVELRLKCMIANMVKSDPNKRIFMEEVEKQINCLIGW
jgi:hypothetical protein